MNTPSFQIDASNNLICGGDWLITTLTAAFESQLFDLEQTPATIDTSQVGAFDSAGALLLLSMINKFPQAQLNITTQHQNLLNLVKKVESPQKPTSISNKRFKNPLAYFGLLCFRSNQEFIAYLGFIGEIACLALLWLIKPARILWRGIMKTIENTGFYAIPIVGLLSFLVGVVLAYQMGVQLENYGANIFVVNLLGLSLLREFSPLMTAIIIAGRSGSAFAAELGTMKINQEIDALSTIGVNPVEYLVLSKISGLVISLPLLTMWGSFMGIFGGMIMAKVMLGITFTVFCHQFHEAIAIKHLWIGLMKTPFFAFLIASVGCFQGLSVEGGAESVGLQTTRSVVQSLFLIIITDAFFSILLSWLHA